MPNVYTLMGVRTEEYRSTKPHFVAFFDSSRKLKKGKFEP